MALGPLLPALRGVRAALAGDGTLLVMASTEPSGPPTSRSLRGLVAELESLMAPLFVSVDRPLLERLPRKAANLWHRTVNRKQLAFNRQAVTILTELIAQAEATIATTQLLAQADQDLLKLNRAATKGVEDNRITIDRLADEIHGLHRWLGQQHENQQIFSERATYLDQRLSELMLQVRDLADPSASVDLEATESRVIDEQRYQQFVHDLPGGPRLNVGCGADTREDYLNVDARELPGVDVVADVRHLPFEPGTVAEVFASHTIEHFREHQLRGAVLPHWVELLRPGGQLRLLCPDLDGLLSRVDDGRLSLQEFRLYMYGAQDYVGNDHFAAYNADLLAKVLEDQGLVDIHVVATDRLSNGCPEIELVATRP